MKNYLIISLLLILSHTQLVAENIYSQLGISIHTEGKPLAVKVNCKKVTMPKKCKLKKVYKKHISQAFKYLKSQKLSEEVTHYGVGIDYKLSNEVAVSIDILADLDILRASKIIKNKQANIRLAISL